MFSCQRGFFNWLWIIFCGFVQWTVVQILAVSPRNHAFFFDWVDLNGLCSYGNKLLTVIVLSFFKVSLTIVPCFSQWLWLSKTGSLKCQGYSGQRERERVTGKMRSSLFPSLSSSWPGLKHPQQWEAAVHPASLNGSLWRAVSADPFCPTLAPLCGTVPWVLWWAELSPCQLLLGSHRLYLCAYISQPGGVTAKTLAVSATLRLCLRSHFCSCACLHLILFALTSMQMQQQAQAVRCSLYYYGFFSLQSLLAS